MFERLLKVQEGVTHDRAWPLTERAQGNTTVLLKRPPPSVRVSQWEEHVHGTTGVGVQLTEGRRGLGQKVMELPFARHRRGRVRAQTHNKQQIKVWRDHLALVYIQPFLHFRHSQLFWAWFLICMGNQNLSCIITLSPLTPKLDLCC